MITTNAQMPFYGNTSDCRCIAAAQQGLIAIGRKLHRAATQHHRKLKAHITKNRFQSLLFIALGSNPKVLYERIITALRDDEKVPQDSILWRHLKSKLR
jgi:hypothetical protein